MTIVLKDTYINEASPTTAYGSGLYARVGSDINDKRQYALLDFGVQAPAGSKVLAANVTLYNWDYSGQLQLKPYAITSSWNESTVTWNTMPNLVDVGAPAQQLTPDASFFVYVDISPVLQWAVDQNRTLYGIALVPVITAVKGIRYDFYTKNNNYQQPELSLDYSLKPNKPSNLNPSGSAADPKIVGSLTPAVTWTHSDPDGEAASAFQVQIIDDSTGLTVHDSGKTVASANNGATMSHTVPAAKLAWNKLYRWKVTTWDINDQQSDWSDLQYFQTNQLPSAAWTGLSSSSSSPTIFQDTNSPTLSWTYADPEADAQRSIQIQILNGAAVVYDSGEMQTSAGSFVIPAAAGLAYDVTYNAKIRAKDANNYAWGSWSSLGYLHLNRQPSSSTYSPIGSSISPQLIQMEGLTTQRFSWAFVDQDATDTQAAYEFELYRADGSLVVSSGQVTSVNKYHDLAASNFTAGVNHYWRVRVKDQHGNWSGWSGLNYFYPNGKPLPSVINPLGSQAAPVNVLDDLTPVLKWTFQDTVDDVQAAFQVKIYNEAGTLLLDTAEIASNISEYTIPQAYKLIYGNKYQWEVKTKDSHGSYSVFSSRAWILPVVGSPTGVTAIADDFAAKIIISWSPSAAEGLQGYNVYRSTDQITWTKINGAIITDVTYADPSILSDVLYYYAVEAFVTDTQKSQKSGSVSATATFSAWYIGDFKFDGASKFKKKNEKSRSIKDTLTRRIIQDAGVIGSDISMELTLLDDDYSTGKEKYDALMIELNKTSIISLRDPFGGQWDVSVGDWDEEPIVGTGKAEYVITIELTEVK